MQDLCNSLDGRIDAIYPMLRPDADRTVADLMKILEHCPAFRGLKGQSLRNAIVSEARKHAPAWVKIAYRMNKFGRQTMLISRAPRDLANSLTRTNGQPSDEPLRNKDFCDRKNAQELTHKHGQPPSYGRRPSAGREAPQPCGHDEFIRSHPSVEGDQATSDSGNEDRTAPVLTLRARSAAGQVGGWRVLPGVTKH